MNAIEPGRSGASVIRAIRPPDASWSAWNSPQEGSRTASSGWAPRYPSTSEIYGPSRWIPATRAATSGSASQASAIVRTPCIMAARSAVIRVGQSRAVPSSACARTTSATWPDVSDGSENEMPHRPLVWMSQNAGAIHSSSSATSGGPSAGTTSAIVPSRVVRPIHSPVRKWRVISVIAALILRYACLGSAHLHLGPGPLAMDQGGGDEVAEERVGLGRLRLELGM